MRSQGRLEGGAFIRRHRVLWWKARSWAAKGSGFRALSRPTRSLSPDLDNTIVPGRSASTAKAPPVEDALSNVSHGICVLWIPVTLAY